MRTSSRVLPPVAAVLLALLALGAGAASAFELSRLPDGTPNLVSPAISANPIEVVLNVRNDVTPADEAWIIGAIEEGLDLWEQVPTSHVRFETTVVHSASPPPVQPGKLTVDVGYNLSSGGATAPSGGNPGRWLGANAAFPVASRPRFKFVAAHEIAHALGILHSTISDKHYALPTHIPVMHFAGADAPGLTPDDVAAISVAYPEASSPLDATHGTIRGRCVGGTTGLPIGGVNVVAVDSGGIPRVARLSSAEGVPGEFRIVGLPPGSYTLDVLGGRSFGGMFVGMASIDVQADNFAAFSVPVGAVAAGAVHDVGEVAITPFPLSIDRIAGVDHRVDAGIDPASGMLPAIGSTTAVYVGRMHVRGGVHPISLTASSGLVNASANVTAVQTLSADPSGDTYLQVVGVAFPIAEPSFTITDAHGASLDVDAEIPLLLLKTGTLRWKTPTTRLKVDLKGTLAKPDFDPAALPAGAGQWRVEVSRIVPAVGTVIPYTSGVIPELRCSTSGRACAGTVTGTSPSGKTKLSLRLTRSKVAGEWAFRVSISNDPLAATSNANQTVRVSLCPLDGAQCLVAEWPFTTQGTRAVRYRS